MSRGAKVRPPVAEIIAATRGRRAPTDVGPPHNRVPDQFAPVHVRRICSCTTRLYVDRMAPTAAT
jgi:hypothetical protein